MPLPCQACHSALLFTVLLCAASGASAQSPAGLPAGGGLDVRKVVEQRYGAAVGPAAMQRIEGSLATVMLDNVEGGAAGELVPVTFGQVFAPGVLARDAALHGKTAADTSTILQTDIKATHPDGSVRHAVISALVPRPIDKKPLALALMTATPSRLSSVGTAKVAPLPDPGRLAGGASVTAVIDGKRYTASLDRLLRGVRTASWLAGPIVNEWHVSGPLRSEAGEEHPHLSARFALRAYTGTQRARVDITVENNWAFEPGPRNFTYDAEIRLNDAPAYERSGLVHYHHARWRKIFWVGGDPGVDVRSNMQDLIASRAVPNYDPEVVVPEAALAGMQARWRGAHTEPMGTGEATPYMPTTGGRSDIGLLPGWAAAYVVSADIRAKRVTLGTGDLAGSYSVHFRDKRTGRPVSLLDYPYMTVNARHGDSLNPASGKHEKVPGCAAEKACATPNDHDLAHQPSLAYLPYLLTGDHYYLEELQFWAMYNVTSSHPGYRDNKKGLLKGEQVRGQAWGLRTLAHAAYITPDKDALKQPFLQILESNLDWYTTTYPANPQANKLGVIVNGYALEYNGNTALAPWQDDFFTSAVGHAAELGFAKAQRLLAWKAGFPVARMIGPGTCWIEAAIYAMKVRDTPATPFYTSIGQAYRASHTPEFLALPCGGAEMAAALKLKTAGDMPSYSDAVVGTPSNLQPALAYAVGVAGADGRKAWERFMARSVKPDYGLGPQFAIVPR